ncbi:MAG: threonine/serine exporter family protein [Tissierellia bacterium]|nr:threonine/serine exporter family protein [Tissierellia bacterium]
MMELFFEFILGFFAVIGYAYYYNIPYKTLHVSGFIGAVGWTMYNLGVYFDVANLGVFIGSICIGFLGEFFSRKYKLPATIYLIPGIIPLVPGMSMYFMMYNIVMKNYYEAFNQGLNAAVVAGAISIGLFIASSTWVKITRVKNIVR